jgi:carbonic anhydrase
MSIQRRQCLQWVGLLMGGAVLAGDPRAVRAAGALDPELLQELNACTPSGDLLEALLAGNRRFAAAWASASKVKGTAQRMEALATLWTKDCQIDPHALSQGQKPWAALLTCADSRVAPEWMFAKGSGELFKVTSAGNTAFDDGIASLEYAVSVLGVSLVLVMGHSGCGAVKAAMAREPLTPLLEGLVRPIRASLQPGDDLTRAIQGNARHSAARLTARSAVLKQAAEAGTLRIRSAYFDIGSGQVSLL